MSFHFDKVLPCWFGNPMLHTPVTKHPSVILTFRIACVLLTASWLQTASAQSEALAEDTFDYSSGDLNGMNGGFGWKSPWFVKPDTAFEAVANGIRPTGGTEDGVYNQGIRVLSSPTPDTGVIYFSVEIQTSEMQGQYYTALKLHQGTDGGAQEFVSIGIQNDRVYGTGGTLAQPEGQIEDVGRSGTFILVGKIEFQNESTSNLSVWVNPHDEADGNAMKTFTNVGLSNKPFVLVELNAVKLVGTSGEITFRNLVVSTAWPVPLKK